jgi:hypothetical protein
MRGDRLPLRYDRHPFGRRRFWQRRVTARHRVARCGGKSLPHRDNSDQNCKRRPVASRMHSSRAKLSHRVHSADESWQTDHSRAAQKNASDRSPPGRPAGSVGVTNAIVNLPVKVERDQGQPARDRRPADGSPWALRAGGWKSVERLLRTVLENWRTEYVEAGFDLFDGWRDLHVGRALGQRRPLRLPREACPPPPLWLCAGPHMRLRSGPGAQLRLWRNGCSGLWGACPNADDGAARGPHAAGSGSGAR